MTNEQMPKKTIERWNTLIDQYVASDKKVWKDKNNGNLYPVMKVPSVCQMLGMPHENIYVFGSFFWPSIDPHEHLGMTLDILRQIPNQCINPLLIGRGSKPNSYLMVLTARDENNATVVVPLEVGKRTTIGKVSVLNSAYGKTRGRHQDIPAFGWLRQFMTAENLFYMNKAKSTEWIQSYRGLFPADAKTFDAFDKSIISAEFQKVKTEEDLNLFRKQQEKDIVNDGEINITKTKLENAYQVARADERAGKDDYIPLLHVAKKLLLQGYSADEVSTVIQEQTMNKMFKEPRIADRTVKDAVKSLQKKAAQKQEPKHGR